MHLFGLSTGESGDAKLNSGTTAKQKKFVLEPFSRERGDQHQAHDGAAGRCGSLKNLILKRYPFRIVFRKPFFSGILARKYLEMVDVADILAGVDIDQHGFHWSLFSLRFPQ
jgi:hypothetical protein